MGANNSTRRVSFESDENENITVVKGIRLSENVINRMREPASPPKHQHGPSPTPSRAPTHTPPVLRPMPPLFDPVASLPPPPVVEPVATPAPPPPPLSSTESVAAPPPPLPHPSTEQVAAPTITEMVLPSSLSSPAANTVTASASEFVATPHSPPPPPSAAAAEPVTLPRSLPLTPPPPPMLSIDPLIPASCPAPAVVEVITPLAPPDVVEPSRPFINHSIGFSPPVTESIAPSYVAEPIPPPPHIKIEPITSPPITKPDPLSSLTTEPVTILPPHMPPSGDTLSSHPAEPLVAPPLPEFTAPCEPIAPPPQPPVKPVSPAPVSEPVPKTSPVTPPATPAVDEEALRKKITDELYKSLEQERAKTEQELQAWLQAEKARASAQAHAEAQSQVQDEVSRILTVERALTQESIQQAFIRERISTEDERLRAQLFDIGRKAKQLEAREADLRKQDAFYREQVARLEERSAQFYKVTTENYHKAADQVNAKFKRYEAYPVCADLQGQILACYKENVGKTLHCSNIAALYLQCVNNVKQNKLRAGG